MLQTKHINRILVLLVGGSLLGSGSSATPRYAITDLGSLQSSGFSSAYAINDAGQVVGDSRHRRDLYSRAFLYKNGEMTDIGSLGGPGATARGMSNSGHITGTSRLADGTWRAFIYTEGNMYDLGDAHVWGINATGQVTGAVGCKAVLFDGDSMKALGHFGAAYTCAAGVAINDLGQVTGHAGTNDGRLTAFLYTDGEMLDLGALSDGQSTSGTAINNLGQVVSYGSGLGFLYSDGKMHTIEVPETHIYPWGINDQGLIVGQANPNDNRPYAFVYSEGKILNLNELVVDFSEWEHLSIARGINMSGQIVGSGKILTGETRGFLLNPLPISASR